MKTQLPNNRPTRTRAFARILGGIIAGLLTAQSAKADLVGYWKLDEGTGGAGATTSDFSTTNANGTLNGPPTWVAGQYGNALNFAGTTSQYVSIPITSGSPLIIGSNATPGAHSFTVACWVYQTGLGYGEMFCFGNGGSRKFFVQTGNSGGETSYVWSDSNGGFRMNGTGQVIGANAWHHIAVTYDSGAAGGTNSFKFYYDGVLKKQQNLGNTQSLGIVAGDTLRIGGPTGVASQPWNGRVDDLVVLNNAATGGALNGAAAGDVLQIMNGTHPAMLRYWTGAGTPDGGGNLLWTDTNNWGGAGMAAGKVLTFATAAGPGLTTNLNNFANNTLFNGIIFNPATGSFTLNGNAVNLTGNVVNNSANVQTIGTSLVLDGGTRTFNTAAGDIAVSNAIGEANGTNGLTKSGSFKLTLNGSNTYGGPTQVSAGTLLLSNSSLAGAATVSGTATLAVAGSVAGLVTMGSGTTLATGVDTTTTVGQFDANAGLTLTTTSLNMKLNAINTLVNVADNSDVINVTGNLTLNGASQVVLTQLGFFDAGDYTLINYSGSLLGAGSIAPPPNDLNFNYAIDTTGTPGQVILHVTYAPASKVWKGNINNVWDIHTTGITGTANWFGPAKYNEGGSGNDGVIFDDTATGSKSVSLSVTVTPNSVTFNNTGGGGAYTLSGSGGIAGTTTLAVSGGGTVNLATANTYTGATNVTSGTLNIANTNALAGSTLNNTAGTVTVDSSITAVNVAGLIGSVGFALDNTAAGAVALGVGATNATTSYGGALSGTGSLTKNGSGTFTLTSDATYSGSTTVNGGTLDAQNLTGTSGLTVTGGTLNAISYNASSGLSVSVGASANISGTGMSLAAVNNAGTVNFTGASGTTTLSGLSGAGGTTFTSSAVINGAVSSGTVTINGATGQITTLNDANVVLGSGTALTVTNGGTQTTGTITGGSLTVTGGTLTLGVGSTWGTTSVTGTGTALVTQSMGSGSIVINGGTITTSTLGGAAGILFTNNGTSNGTLELTGGTGNLVINQAGTGTAMINVGAGGNLTVRRSGGNYQAIDKGGLGTLTIANGTLEDGGSLAVTQGTVVLAGATFINGLFANVDNVTNVQAGATVKLGTAAGGQVFYNGVFTMNGGTFDVNGFSGGQVPAISGSGFITNSGVASAVAQFRINGTKTFSGDIVNGTGIVGINISAGGGTWILSGINTYGGATTQASGTLRAGSTTAFSPNSAYTVNAGQFLDLAGFNNSVGSLAGAGTVRSTGGPATLTEGANGLSTAFTGGLQDGTGILSLEKTGSGIFTLSSAAGNTYSGTTNVSGGTLNLGTTGNIAGSAVTVGGFSTALAGGQTAAYTSDTLTAGKLASLTVDAFGSAIPGGAGTGGLGVLGNLTMNASSNLTMNIAGAGGQSNAFSNYDMVIVGGTVSLGAGVASLNLSSSFTATASDIYFLVKTIDDVTPFGAGNYFDGFAEGATFSLNSQTYKITYLAEADSNSFTGGNDIAIMLNTTAGTWGFTDYAAYYAPLGAATADDDGDGLSNLMEYALGTDPKVDSNPAITYSLNGSNQNQIVYSHRIAGSTAPNLAPTDPLTFQGEVSNDGLTWVTTGVTSSSDSGTPIETVTVTDTAFSTGTAAKRLIRLKVSTP